MKTMSDAQLVAAIHAADPAALATVSPADAVRAVQRARPARARRRWALLASVLAATVAVGVPVGAVASGYLARTGWFASPNPGDDRDPRTVPEYEGGEWIDLSAPDLDAVVQSVYPEWMPLAPGVTREDLTARVVDIVATNNAFARERLLRRTFESESYKDWLGAWITAYDSGDSGGQMTAARVLTEASDWPTLVATDGGGVTDVMRAYAERIAAGDRDAAQAMAQFEGAPSWDGIDRSALGAKIYDEVLGARE